MLSTQLEEIVCSYASETDKSACLKAIEIALQKERSLLLGSLQAQLIQFGASNELRKVIDNVIFDERLLF